MSYQPRKMRLQDFDDGWTISSMLGRFQIRYNYPRVAGIVPLAGFALPPSLVPTTQANVYSTSVATRINFFGCRIGESVSWGNGSTRRSTFIYISYALPCSTSGIAAVGFSLMAISAAVVVSIQGFAHPADTTSAPRRSDARNAGQSQPPNCNVMPVEHCVAWTSIAKIPETARMLCCVADRVVM